MRGMEAGHGGWQRACQAICLSGETLPGDEKYFHRGLQKPKALPISLLGPQTNYNSGAHLSGRQPPLVTGFSAWMLAVLNSRESSYVPT